jgi:rare lipoprotein A
MRYATKFGGMAASLLMLGSCGSVGGVKDGGLETASAAPVVPTHTTYTPVDIANYDEVGYASHYGAELAGRPTANGESFIPTAVSAAHKTLPMPSYVEVTALDTGRTILVRVNDRGPFANDRLIDLSDGAARQLGITAQGVSGVRVRKVNPPEQERAVLRDGMLAAERLETPDSLLRVLRDKLAKLPKPAAMASKSRPLPVASKAQRPVTAPNTAAPSTDDRFIREGAGSPARTATPRSATPASVVAGDYVVQVGAFSNRSRADQMARKLGASVAASADGRLFRVRYGPYATEAEAARKLATVKQRGYPQARLYRD